MTCFAKAGVEELDLNPTERLWDEPKRRMCTGPPRPKSVNDPQNPVPKSSGQPS